MDIENPYESPKTTQPSDPSIAFSVAVFMAGLPFVIFGVQGVAACLYWFVQGEYDSGMVLNCHLRSKSSSGVVRTIGLLTPVR